ncbi:transcriptional regulator [Escherichia coli]|uniref:transcriptional regulator n=1 Tax=Escherichia coli TaxID=562 RepID=UPI00397FD423
MVKKTIYVNPDADKTEKYLIEVLHLEQEENSEMGKEDSICKNGVTPGFNAIDDGPEYKINEDPMDKVDKALATPFPRDVEKLKMKNMRM